MMWCVSAVWFSEQSCLPPEATFLVVVGELELVLENEAAGRRHSELGAPGGGGPASAPPRSVVTNDSRFLLVYIPSSQP